MNDDLSTTRTGSAAAHDDLPTTLTGPVPGIELRRASAADIPGIVDLLADDAFGRQRDGRYGAEGLAPYLRAYAAVDADPAHLLLVAAHGAEVVATAHLVFLQGLARRGAMRAQVEAVRVASGYRGGGVGTAMMAWATTAARRRGAVLIQLTSDKRRTDAHRFYERLGFVVSHEGLKLQL